MAMMKNKANVELTIDNEDVKRADSSTYISVCHLAYRRGLLCAYLR